jgi:hypothetical protein
MLSQSRIGQRLVVIVQLYHLRKNRKNRWLVATSVAAIVDGMLSIVLVLVSFISSHPAAAPKQTTAKDYEG